MSKFVQFCLIEPTEPTEGTKRVIRKDTDMDIEHYLYSVNHIENEDTSV